MNWGSGGDSVVGVYSDARTEYTKQLCVFLVPAYFQFFINLLEKSKSTAEPKKFLWQFQTYLNEIPEWNMEKVSNEISSIQTNCGCDYIEDLLTAVFIAHTKVLTAIRISSKQKKIQINVPKVEHFLYKVLCESSKLLWGSTYLFSDSVSSIEKQKNYRNVEHLLNEAVVQAVRAMVPVKSILKDFVSQEDGEEEEAEETKQDAKQEVEDEEDAIAAALAGKASSVPESKPEEKPETQIESKPEEKPETQIESEAEVKPEAMPELAPAIIENETKPENQVISAEPPRIIINDRSQRSVSFSEFDTVLDEDNPEKSDLYEQKEHVEPELEILDEVGVPLTGDDIENLGDEDDTATIGDELEMGADEYDVMN
jgi:hypothetical protein